MSWLTDLIGKGVDKIWPDKSKAREQQTALNQEELRGAPTSRLRLWRSFLGWALSVLLVWEVMLRPVIATYWPDVPLPPSKLEEVGKILLFMLGGAF
jgi:hypothetical protein